MNKYFLLWREISCEPEKGYRSVRQLCKGRLSGNWINTAEMMQKNPNIQETPVKNTPNWSKQLDDESKYPKSQRK